MMDIETILLIIAPIGSIALFVRTSLYFTKSQKAKRVRSIAFRIWASCLILIFTILLGYEIIRRIREHEGLDLKGIGLIVLLGGLLFLYIRTWRDFMAGR